MDPAAPSPAPGPQVLLRRGPEGVESLRLGRHGGVEAIEQVADGTLAAHVRALEPGHPRWTWDDTTRWYPDLLAAGVRVERCRDLRLGHAILRASPLVDLAAHDGPDSPGWDALRPGGDGTPTLFGAGEVGADLDPLAELARQDAALAASGARAGLSLLLAAESSGALVAAELTHAGLPWRRDVHAAVLQRLSGPRPAGGQPPEALQRLRAGLREELAAPDLNPDSPASLLQALRGAGLTVDDTRSSTLERLDHPAVPALLAYKQLSRLLSTNGWAWLDTWVHDGRFRPEYLVGGVVTGRWSSRGGGALTVPGPLREAVVADDGWSFVVADAAQLEPRVLAGLSRDTAMAEAGRGRDLYQGMVDSGAVATRAEAKGGVLGAMYGGTRGESGRMVARLAQRYPAALAHVEAAARAGERGEVVATRLGRGSPVADGAWTRDRSELDAPDPAREQARRSWGRFTRNFVVQGTAAEWALAWLALLRNRLWALGEDPVTGGRPHLVLFLHDEVVVHAPRGTEPAVQAAVEASARDAGALLFEGSGVDFPLEVSVVQSWAQAR